MGQQEIIKIGDLSFKPYLSVDEIRQQVVRVAQELSTDLKGKNPIFLVVLNGAFMFAADLMRELRMPCEVYFVRFSSYEGTHTTGAVREVLGLNTSIEGRTVVIVEDIVDTGLTMKGMIEKLKSKNPKEIHVATLFLKPHSLREDINVQYCCFEIPNDFIVGYGLDYNQAGRNLPQIYVVDEPQRKD